MKTNTKHWASITAGILSLVSYVSAASLGSEKYTYDTSGNILEKIIDEKVTRMTYSSSNQVYERQFDAGQREAINYDAAGRPIALIDVTGQQTQTIRYGYGDKVLEAKHLGDYTEFYYNSDGQLVGKKNAHKLTASLGMATI